MGEPALAVWEWSYVEQMSTGRCMVQLGVGRGRHLLEVADRWAEAPQIRP